MKFCQECCDTRPCEEAGECLGPAAAMEAIERVARALCRLDGIDPDDMDTGSTFPTRAACWRRYKLKAETAISAIG